MNDISFAELIAAAAVGWGLAAAVGFRVFLPLLLAGLATRFGHLPLADGFVWLASTPALVMFGLAAVLEIVAYFVPVFDHLLDLVAHPAAVIAGTLLMASTLVDLAPWLRWAVALIAGGGTASLLHHTTAGLRLGSTATTAGLANPLLAGVETGLATVLVVLAIAVPLAAVAAVLFLLIKGSQLIRRLLPRRAGA